MSFNLSHRSHVILLAVFVLGLGACQKGQPEIDSLRSLQGLSLDQSSVLFRTRTQSAYKVTGKCSSQISEIQLSTDGGTTYVPAASLASTSTINCGSSGLFELNFAPQSTLEVGLPVGSGTKTLLFRGTGELGNTDVLPVVLTLPEGWHMITAGSNSVGNPNYKLTGRIRSTINSGVSNNGYRLTGAIHQ